MKRSARGADLKFERRAQVVPAEHLTDKTADLRIWHSLCGGYRVVYRLNRYLKRRSPDGRKNGTPDRAWLAQWWNTTAGCGPFWDCVAWDDRREGPKRYRNRQQAERACRAHVEEIRRGAKLVRTCADVIQ